MHVQMVCKLGRREKNCDSPISLASQDCKMSEFAADASVNHYPWRKEEAVEEL